MYMFTHDKLMHYFAGSIIAGLGLPFMGASVILLVLFMAILKEGYDYFSGKGTPEWMDIVWTALGGLVVISAYLL